MSLKILLSGLIATYLAVSPCLIFGYHAHAKSGSHHIVAGVNHSHSHDHSHSQTQGDHHGESNEEPHDDEHCCDHKLHAPASLTPVSFGLVALVPAQFEVVNLYDHVSQKTALSRDGPIFEEAREFANTIVIRV